VTDLAVLYEHPKWFEPLFSVLSARGIDFQALKPDGDFDPQVPAPPAKVVFNRIAMSSFLRDAEHPIFYAQSLFEHWEQGQARGCSTASALNIDTSKARQMSLIASLGLKGARDPRRAPSAADHGSRRREPRLSRCWSRPISAGPAPASPATRRRDELRRG
jgi:hypothetical protein